MNLDFVELQRPYAFVSPFVGDEFVAWIMSNDPLLTDGEMNLLARALVSGGCRYAVCSGIRCSQWDDAIDWANIERFPNEHVPEDRFVMTTWHDDESVMDIALFFTRLTAFGSFVPRNFLVVSVGPGSRSLEALRHSRRLLVLGPLSCELGSGAQSVLRTIDQS
jgi:hypothetical protein